MANLSSAFGTVTIQTDTQLAHKLKDFIYLLMKSNATAWYTIDLDIDQPQSPDETIACLAAQGITIASVESTLTKDYYIASVTIPFTGIGRWSFQNNVEWFFKSVFDPKYIANFSDEDMTLVKELMLHDWQATFDYWDEESGIAFIEHRIQTEFWNTTTRSQETASVLSVDSYDYNVENLITYFDYEAFNERVDKHYVLTHYQEFLTFVTAELNDNAGSSDYLEQLSSIQKDPNTFKKIVQASDDDGIYYHLSDFLDGLENFNG